MGAVVPPAARAAREAPHGFVALCSDFQKRILAWPGANLDSGHMGAMRQEEKVQQAREEEKQVFMIAPGKSFLHLTKDVRYGGRPSTGT